MGRGGFRVQKKVVTNFCKIDTIYIKVIALIFVFIVVVIIIIANVAILFCFETLVVAAWYMPMLVASEIPSLIKFANSSRTNDIMVFLLIWSAKDRWKYTKSCFKENARICFKNSATQGNIRISGPKKRLRNLYEKRVLTKN